MRVVSMALLEATRYLIAALCLIFVVAAQWWPSLVFVNALLLFLALSTLIVDIPLSLNWSRSMYGGLLTRFAVYVVFTIGVYAAHYHYGGIRHGDNPTSSWVDAIYSASPRGQRWDTVTSPKRACCAWQHRLKPSQDC